MIMNRVCHPKFGLIFLHSNEQRPLYQRIIFEILSYIIGFLLPENPPMFPCRDAINRVSLVLISLGAIHRGSLLFSLGAINRGALLISLGAIHRGALLISLGAIHRVSILISLDAINRVSTEWFIINIP